MLANDEHAVALYTARAERAGKHLEEDIVLVFHIRDGKGPRTGSIQLISMQTMSSGRNAITQAIDAARRR